MGTMQRKKNSGHTAGPRCFWNVHSYGALMAKVTAAGLGCFKRKMEARRLQPHLEFDEVCRSFNRGEMQKTTLNCWGIADRSAADVTWRSAGSGLWTTNTETKRIKSSSSRSSSSQQQRQQVGANFDPLLGKKRGGEKKVQFQIDHRRGKKDTVSIVTIFRLSGCLHSRSAFFGFSLFPSSPILQRIFLIRTKWVKLSSIQLKKIDERKQRCDRFKTATQQITM